MFESITFDTQVRSLILIGFSNYYFKFLLEGAYTTLHFSDWTIKDASIFVLIMC